jgi:hypothetical protein
VPPESRDIGARIYDCCRDNGVAKHVSPHNEQQQLGTVRDNDGILTVVEGVPYPEPKNYYTTSFIIQYKKNKLCYIIKPRDSPPTSVEVKKMWIYTSTPPYTFMA